MCAVICRKATVALPDANYLSSQCQSQSSRAQNRDFCALVGSGSPVFGHFEHKIEVFVRFWGLDPQFSGVSSTKSGFLCFFGLRNVSVSAITCHQYKESRVSGPAILSSICLGEGLGRPRLCIREAKRLFC